MIATVLGYTSYETCLGGFEIRIALTLMITVCIAWCEVIGREDSITHMPKCLHQ